MAAIDPEQLRSQLAQEAPALWNGLSELTDEWMKPVLHRLANRNLKSSFPKTFNDPIWKVIVLLPWETLLLDSPMLQRLRGVRQLGMAHYVYPGAGYDRLEHSRGVVQAAQRIIDSLRRNADYRRNFGKDSDEAIPEPSDLDIVSIRLAALLHDIGHAPFSHTTENLVQLRHADEFERLKACFLDTFEGASHVAPAEIISVLMIMTPALTAVFNHPNFSAVSDRAELPAAISARIMGSRACLKATYLSGVISGPLDADKLDYMARDSHHAGLSIGLDIERLISKMEVVTVTPDSAPNLELRRRAQAAHHHRFYEMGISISGLGAYEQMIISRVILFDRLYYHHKVRAAEAMVRQLIILAEEKRGKPFTVKDFYALASDDVVLGLLSGDDPTTTTSPIASRVAHLEQSLRDRSIYYRAYAFAPRFIKTISTLSEQDRQDTVVMLWNPLLNLLAEPDGAAQLAGAIREKAYQLAATIPELEKATNDLQVEHILVDLPSSHSVVRGGDILTRTEDGHVSTPNLFFDPERWSHAYVHRKQCGFIFTPSRFVKVVGLASRIVFYELFRLVMDHSADRASKTVDNIKDDWIKLAGDKGLCSSECVLALVENRPCYVHCRAEDVKVPDGWLMQRPDLPRSIAAKIDDAIPLGLPAQVHKSLFTGLYELATFVDMMEHRGVYVGHQGSLLEKDLQARLLDHLRSREVNAREGTEFAGGETDVLLPGDLIVENKVFGETSDPHHDSPKANWQTRRYSIAICRDISFQVVAYKPKNEEAILILPERLDVQPLVDGKQNHVVIRFVLPYGHPTPSNVKDFGSIEKGTTERPARVARPAGPARPAKASPHARSTSGSTPRSRKKSPPSE